MNSYALEFPLIQTPSSSSQTGTQPWTVRHAVEGTQIFGGIGSGKTSGSGRMIAIRFLNAGFGGLVLTVKSEEKEMWEEYCAITNRTDDLIVIEPGGNHRFNFLEYESQNADGSEALTENIVDVLKTVIRASEAADQGKSDDSFWETALDMLIFNVIDLCKMANGRVTLQELYDIVLSLPKVKDTASLKDMDKTKAFFKAFTKAHSKAIDAINDREAYLTRVHGSATHIMLTEEEMLELPEARLFKFLDLFFLETFKNLSEKTRSIIEFTFSGFLFRLLREPVFSLFCKGTSTITPEDSIKGKIILVNLPVKKFNKVGRDCQILFKYIWQRAMEKRKVAENSRPVFLWSDEAQNFLHEHDANYQATARSSKIATVYISQNLPNYHARMGGAKSEYLVQGFLGTLGTKIFHANADIETNKYASELIGETMMDKESVSTSSTNGTVTSSHTVNREFERTIKPEEFARLNTGGERNNYKVQGILHRQGDAVNGNRSFVKMIFDQKIKS